MHEGPSLRQFNVISSTEPAAIAPATPFQIRGRAFTAVVLKINGAADAAFFQALDAKLAQAPHFFTNAPFVLDLESAVGLGRSGDFTGLVRELRARKLSVIGLQNGTVEQNTAALAAGLVPLQGGRDLPGDPGAAPAERAAPAPAADAPGEPAPTGTVLLTEPVRSGQRVFADRGDLVVVASVSSGAERIAVGNIHIYGALRGRALAGVNGDLRARIFCQSLEAELIAIAGLYKTSDDLGEAAWKQRVQAYLDAEALRVDVLK